MTKNADGKADPMEKGDPDLIDLDQYRKDPATKDERLLDARFLVHLQNPGGWRVAEPSRISQQPEAPR